MAKMRKVKVMKKDYSHTLVQPMFETKNSELIIWHEKKN
jgi:hypothetical protein